jgi:hypothetical protein
MDYEISLHEIKFKFENLTIESGERFNYGEWRKI